MNKINRKQPILENNIILENKSVMQMVLSKMSAEDHHGLNYKKVVVPQSMRSIYWKFFGFPATEDGEILTKVKIVCLLCKTQIAYNRNTSNLRMHLQNKHNQELIQLESTTPPKKVISSKEKRGQKKLSKSNLNNQQHIYTTNIDGTVHVDGNIEFVTDQNVNLSNLEEDMNIDQPVNVVIKSASSGSTSSTSNHQNVTYIMADDNTVQNSSIDERSLSDVIATFIITDLQLPDIVEGHGFQRLIRTLNGPCDISLPSKIELEQGTIPKLCEKFRDSIVANLSCINSEIGITIEEWNSNTNEAFFTFSVYYQNAGETVLDMKVLSTLHGPAEWNEIHWGNAIDTLLNEWELKIDKITAVVIATTRPELLMALKNRDLNVVTCLLYSLQVCAQACFETPEVENILSKCRTFIGAITIDRSVGGAFNLQEQIQQLTGTELKMDYPSIWTTTYNMLEQMILRRGIISSIVYTDDGVEQSIPELTNEQWKIMEDLVLVLETLKDTIMTLSEEKIPLISLIRPLLRQLVENYLKSQNNDSDIAKSFKESLSSMLVEHYDDANVSVLLKTATTLDPRFKQFPYMTDDEKNITIAPIKSTLENIIKHENTENDETLKHENEPSIKKSRISRIQSMLGAERSLQSSKMSANEKADLELQQYQSEESALLESCPLQWWANNISKCPNLAKLARRYNCVPACCIPPSRILPEVQILHNIRRANLPPNLADKLIFLHGNYHP